MPFSNLFTGWTSGNSNEADEYDSSASWGDDSSDNSPDETFVHNRDQSPPFARENKDSVRAGA